MTDVIVAVPTIVRFDLLERLLASCAAGSRRPDGYLVIDNSKGLHDFSGVDVYRPRRNLGVAGSWNHALKAYPNSHVVIANDDIIMPPTAIEEMVRAGEAASVPTHVRIGDFKLHMHTPGVVDVVGWYDERFWPAYYEDIDYFRRCACAGLRMINLPMEVPGDVNGTLARAPRLRRKIERGRIRGERYYRRKWGGPPGEERFRCPFDGKSAG